MSDEQFRIAERSAQPSEPPGLSLRYPGDEPIWRAQGADARSASQIAVSHLHPLEISTVAD
jgi:hypothetical protein